MYGSVEMSWTRFWLVEGNDATNIQNGLGQQLIKKAETLLESVDARASRSITDVTSPEKVEEKKETKRKDLLHDVKEGRWKGRSSYSCIILFFM